MTDKSIIMLETAIISPHPDNPRKNLGDITELKESIKQSGLLQNLTVVPNPEKEGEYRALIGHRRLAAAKAAELQKVPCVVIEDLSRADQIAIMVSENMQRQDLTIAEQVESIQLMFDLGESVESISEKTGLGKSTVYKRKKLTEYDSDEFRKSVERGATMADYEKLSKIDSEERRNKVLKSIGTNNFLNELQKALNEEDTEKKRKHIEEELSKWAKKVENLIGLETEYVNCFGIYASNQEKYLEKPEKDGEYIYVYNWGCYTIYRVKGKHEDTRRVDEQKELLRQREIENQKREARRQELSNLDERMYKLRRNFIAGITPAEANSMIYKVAEFLVRAIWYYNFEDYNIELMRLLGAELTEDQESFLEYPFNSDESIMYCENTLDNLCSRESVCRTMLGLAYVIVQDNKDTTPYSKNNETYSASEEINMTYQLLERIGYEKSDEEDRWCNGTHELWKKKEDSGE